MPHTTSLISSLWAPPNINIPLRVPNPFSTCKADLQSAKPWRLCPQALCLGTLNQSMPFVNYSQSTNYMSLDRPHTESWLQTRAGVVGRGGQKGEGRFTHYNRTIYMEACNILQIFLFLKLDPNWCDKIYTKIQVYSSNST